MLELCAKNGLPKMGEVLYEELGCIEGVQTPAQDSILKHQQLVCDAEYCDAEEERVIRWLFGVLGRLMYKIGDLVYEDVDLSSGLAQVKAQVKVSDKWQDITFIHGTAETGISTIALHPVRRYITSSMANDGFKLCPGQGVPFDEFETAFNNRERSSKGQLTIDFYRAAFESYQLSVSQGLEKRVWNGLEKNCRWISGIQFSDFVAGPVIPLPCWDC